MSFAAICIALLLERFFDFSHLRHWGWYVTYQRWVIQKLPGQSSKVWLAATILPLVMLLGLVEWLTSGMAFGFVKLLFSVVVLLYCFGPRNLWADTFACLNALSAGDEAAAMERLKLTFDINNQSDFQEMHGQLVNRIFIQANRRVFALVFWMGCTGLLGMAFYRLLSLVALLPGTNHTNHTESPLSGTAQQVNSYLDWLPIRVLAFLFALGGNYNRVFSYWRNKVALGPETNEVLLTQCGVAALSDTIQENMPVDGSVEKEEISLIDRSLVIILVLIAIWVFLIL